MAVYNYRKFKISLDKDSHKVQGLKAGDIIRRQYFNGKSIIYSLMCVLENGVDIIDGLEAPYFIGALLEGDAPQTDELLDFARITNLFDRSRSGALYLTSSDKNSPYMDVIDGIAYNKSLCWPEGEAKDGYEDPKKQYVISDSSQGSLEYIASEGDVNRICVLTKSGSTGSLGVTQDFYERVENPDRVLISFKAKASKALTSTISLRYADGSNVDGIVEVFIGTEWQYYFQAITVDWSGRHLRTVDILGDNMSAEDELCIADLNIILLSSVAAYQDASHVRIGKLDGVSDPVFGNLHGYGGYLQKLFASNSAHISGTLTAGDQNGFMSTFYAGKIHKNAFINSLEPHFTGDGMMADVAGPSGVGKSLVINSSAGMQAQSKEWANDKAGKTYCLSFWSLGSEIPCHVSVLQNGNAIGAIDCLETWTRNSITFPISAISDDSPLIFSFEGNVPFTITSPQLEEGDMPTQYQPTDEVVEESQDYGAWFDRGGIGGTIQNPLLRLNYDGNGAIGTRTRSFLLRPDGSGYFANKNIEWNERGDVTFGENVKLDWENLGENVQDRISSGTYTLEISSSQGNIFQNGRYDTILTAIVRYAGNEVSSDFIAQHFTFRWYKFLLPDIENEVSEWWIEDGVDPTSQSIRLSGEISGRYSYRCELICNDDSVPIPGQ